MKHFTLFLIPALLGAQTFRSGSNGSDGDLTFPTAKYGDVIIFDAKDKVMFPPNGLDLDDDNVFHFKSITIPVGVTVRLTHVKLQGPVYWLSQGDVAILGSLNLDGQESPSKPGTFAEPGAGGYFGGGNRPATDGFGPGGGPKAPSGCSSSREAGAGGKNTANEFLVPLIGGSGGGASSNGYGGGAGGGAILIASDSVIFLGGEGSIYARGGRPIFGGAGGGGSVRLASRFVGGRDGRIYVSADSGACPSEQGKIRIERLTGSGPHVTGNYSEGSPIDPYVPTGTTNSNVSVLSVGGVAVKTSPTGSFDIPDVTIDNKGALPVVIETTNVPVGTIVSMWIYSEAGEAVKIDFPPLTGSGSTRRATASATFPYGFSRGFVRATFTR